MQGSKFYKNQNKIRRHLYRKTAHRSGAVYHSRRTRREWAATRDSAKEIA